MGTGNRAYDRRTRSSDLPRPDRDVWECGHNVRHPSGERFHRTRRPRLL